MRVEDTTRGSEWKVVVPKMATFQRKMMHITRMRVDVCTGT